MECREDEVSCHRCLHGYRSRLEVTYFTDHDDIGILPKQCTKPCGVGIVLLLIDLTLYDPRQFVLYSMLAGLNTSEKKIITLEDPIEYELPGIVQSEVDEKKNYTYATGLRALLRQDPDIIMIGEVRDLESATIAMQAAMTGHLVLSTLHTKSAGETIERLMNMGVPNYILAS